MPTESTVAGLSLEELWEQVRTKLPPTDDKALGTVQVGVTDGSDKPWADTNHGEDRVNLTLELTPEQLELNLTGWKAAQADSFRAWLQSVAGDTAINALPGYVVVAFKRRAYKKTLTSRPWWQDETVEELGTCEAGSYNPGWISRWAFSIRNEKEEKLAFHLRRAWARDEAEGLGDGLPATVEAEVSRLLPILRAIWRSG